MMVVRNFVVMAALLALLAVDGTSAALAAIGASKLLPPILGLGLGSLLPTLPTLPTWPTLPTLPTLPAVSPTGQCPRYTLLNTFTKDAFDNKWFVYQQSHNLAETGWTCKALTYSETSPAFTYSYKHLGVQMSSVGTYTVPIVNPGAFSVQLSNMHVLGADSMGRVNQFVVAGDAVSFMIIRSCTFFPAVPGLIGFNIEYVYVLTRLQVPTAAQITAIATAATNAGIGTGVLRAVDQTGC